MRLVEFRLTEPDGTMRLESVHINPEHVAVVEGHPFIGSRKSYRHTTIGMRDGSRYEVSNDAHAVSHALVCEDVYICEPAAEWGRQK